MNKRVYTYKGIEYPITTLAKMSGLSLGNLKRRLDRGWSVEDAVDTPPRSTDAEGPTILTQPVLIAFPAAIPGVFDHMQPLHSRVYIAYPHFSEGTKATTKIYYIMTLDNGKPLIVYPGEFKVLAIVDTAKPEEPAQA